MYLETSCVESLPLLCEPWYYLALPLCGIAWPYGRSDWEGDGVNLFVKVNFLFVNVKLFSRYVGGAPNPHVLFCKVSRSCLETYVSCLISCLKVRIGLET